MERSLIIFSKILLGLLLGVTAGSTAKIVTVERGLTEKTLSDKDLATIRIYAGISGFAAIAFIIYTFAAYPFIYGFYAIAEVFTGAIIVGFASHKARIEIYEVAIAHLFFVIPLIAIIFYVIG